MQISEEYASQLKIMHSSESKKLGWGVEPPYALIGVIKSHSISSVLDFGCGHGAMMNRLKEVYPELQIQGYDPGIEKYSTFPETVDLIYSTDVLEHIEPYLLDDTLKTLWNTGKCQYHKIACHPAKKTLPDGRNCHLIVESPDWWLEKIKSIIDPECIITHTNMSNLIRKGKQMRFLEIVTIKQ